MNTIFPVSLDILEGINDVESADPAEGEKSQHQGGPIDGGGPGDSNVGSEWTERQAEPDPIVAEAAQALKE